MSSSQPFNMLNSSSMYKQAFIGWGGGKIGIYPKGVGVGADMGYTNMLGVLPIPVAGVDIGGPKKGFTAGVMPDSDTLVTPYIGLRWNSPRKNGISRNFPRGLPEVIYDKLRGRTRDEAFKLSYPDYKEEDEEKKDTKPKPKSKKKKDDDKTSKAAAFGAMMGKLAGDNACRAAMEFDEMTRDVPAEFKRDRRQMSKWIRQTHDKKANYGMTALGGLGGALGTAAGGALIGGLGTLGYDYITNQDEEDRFRRFLRNAAIGGLTGAGLGLVGNAVSGMGVAKPQAAPVVMPPAAPPAAKPEPIPIPEPAPTPEQSRGPRPRLGIFRR